MRRRVYLKDKVGIKPDLINVRDDMIKEIGPQVNDGVRRHKARRDGRFPVEPAVLGHGVQRQQWKHATRD